MNTTNRGRFLPKSSRQFKSELALIAKTQMGATEPFSAPLSVSIHFYKNLKRVTSRNFGDIDNHVKAVLDALNGIVWTDDSLIVELHAFKHSGEPKIIIEVNQIV